MSDHKSAIPTDIDTQIESLLDKFFDEPYPDYNMGLLPDEKGYDIVMEMRNYEAKQARHDAHKAIKALLIQSKISGMEDEHILSPVAGGTGTICSCGKVCGTTDVAQQHIQWNLSLAKDKLLSLKKELE